MSFEYFIGHRFLGTKQKQSFLFLITFLTISGVAIGVMTLIVVIAVMTVFGEDFKNKILEGQPHIVVSHLGGTDPNYHETMVLIGQIDEVVAVSPVLYNPIMIRSMSKVSRAVLKGIDPITAGEVIHTLKNIDLPHYNKPRQNKSISESIPSVVLGAELAKKLTVKVGQTVTLVSPKSKRSSLDQLPVMTQFKITGLFETGMYDYDSTFAFVHIKTAQQLMGLEDAVSGIEVRTKNLNETSETGQKIKQKLGEFYGAMDWLRRNRPIFEMIQMQKLVMFIILTLIVVVAAFNIASTLIMMVMGKTKDIAILKAMGATNKNIMKIFVIKGMIIGCLGTCIGFVLALTICTVLEHFTIVELPPDIYYFATKLPVQMESFNVLITSASALIICFLSTLYPAHQAAKLDPVEAIRYG